MALLCQLCMAVSHPSSDPGECIQQVTPGLALRAGPSMETGEVKLKHHWRYTLEQEAIRIHANLEEKLRLPSAAS